MEKKPVKLSELIEALEFDFPEHIYKIDLQTGRLVMVEECVMRAMEEGDEESLSDVRDWQKHEVEIARAMWNDAGQRFVVRLLRFDGDLIRVKNESSSDE
jgi:hypothetical protein